MQQTFSLANQHDGLIKGDNSNNQSLTRPIAVISWYFTQYINRWQLQGRDALRSFVWPDIFDKIAFFGGLDLAVPSVKRMNTVISPISVPSSSFRSLVHFDTLLPHLRLHPYQPRGKIEMPLQHRWISQLLEAKSLREWRFWTGFVFRKTD